MGLGLTVAKVIIETHRGHIHLNHQPEPRHHGYGGVALPCLALSDPSLALPPFSTTIMMCAKDNGTIF